MSLMPFPTAILLALTLLISNCASTPQSIISVSKIEDIPDISKSYQNELKHLSTGMSIQQVNDLFPFLERECYESGVCHFTVFTEHKVRLDARLTDLKILSGSLISLLALTCAVANESCEKALVAALNVGIATAIEDKNIRGNGNTTDVVSLIHFINHKTIGTEHPNETQRGRNMMAKPNGILTLLQWINIEFENGKVTTWAVNEPLDRFKPKTFTNELPALEDSL